jgi:hypothetical protein
LISSPSRRRPSNHCRWRSRNTGRCTLTVP